MGVTNFRFWVNQSTEDVIVRNLEKPGDNITILAGDEKQRDMWVPWCDEASSFSKHHIHIEAGSKQYWIWQSKGAVRFSKDGAWDANGAGVPGSSKEDGERKVTITRDGHLRVDEA